MDGHVLIIAGERAVIKIAIVAVAVTGSETVMRVATVTGTVTAAPSANVEQIAKLERSRETGTLAYPCISDFRSCGQGLG
jgi:hypothetical protein